MKVFWPVIGVAVSSLLLSVSPVSATADPPATLQTPAVSSGWNDLGADQAILAASPAGSLLADATVRTTVSPSAAIPLDAAVATALATVPTKGPDSVDRFVVSDTSAAWAVGSGAAVLSLWEVDLATGASRTRGAAGLGSGATLLGITDRAWVVSNGGAVVLRAFDGSGDTTFAPADLIRVVAAGTAGLVYLGYDEVPDSAHPGTTVPDQKLRLVSADLVTTTTFYDVGVAPAPTALPQLAASLCQGAIAWVAGFPTRGPGVIGYVDASTPVTTIPRPSYVEGRLAVVLGAVSITAESLFPPQPSWRWVPGQATLVDAGPAQGWQFLDPSSSTAVWPSASTTGAPAFTATVVKEYGGGFGAPPDHVYAWWRWPAAAATPVAVIPSPPVSDRVGTVLGTNGRVLIAYLNPFDVAPRAMAVVRAIAPGTPALLTRHIAGFSGGDATGLSGTRSVIVEQATGAATAALVLRDGIVVTGKASLGTWNPSGLPSTISVSTSGPFTAVAIPDLWQTHGFVVGPTGARVATLPTNLRMVAQDGTRTAYVVASGADGSAWLLDSSLPASRTNPRLLAQHATDVLLSGSRAVTLLRNGTGTTTMGIVDLVHLTTHVISTVQTCSSLSGPLLLCTHSGVLSTLDTAAAHWAFVPVPGWPTITSTSPPPVFAGHVLAWAGDTDPVEGWTTRVKLAPLPAASGSAGAPRLLGPWSQYTAVSTTGPAWAPQMSVSDTLAHWTLTLSDPRGSVVRTWSGTALDGQIRGVAFNGRSASGRQLPVGRYRWILSGSGPYGCPVAAVGTGRATGTVDVVTAIATSASITGPSRVQAGATATITGRLLRSGTSRGLSGRSLTLWRRVGSSSWSPVATASSSTTGRATWKVRVVRSASFVVRYAATPTTRAATSRTLTIRA